MTPAARPVTRVETEISAALEGGNGGENTGGGGGRCGNFGGCGAFGGAWLGSGGADVPGGGKIWSGVVCGSDDTGGGMREGDGVFIPGGEAPLRFGFGTGVEWSGGGGDWLLWTAPKLGRGGGEGGLRRGDVGFKGGFLCGGGRGFLCGGSGGRLWGRALGRL